jgi:hypothetical protein
VYMHKGYEVLTCGLNRKYMKQYYILSKCLLLTDMYVSETGRHLSLLRFRYKQALQCNKQKSSKIMKMKMFVGQGEAPHRKYKRLKLGGGHVYDCSGVTAICRVS